MTQIHRSACSECWDPVDKEGDELCGWCKLNPAQRKRKVLIGWLFLALFFGSAGALLWAVS